MKLETIKKNNKKKILIGGLIVVCLISVIAFTTTRAKYKSEQNVKIASGSVSYKQPDLKLIAIKVSEDGTNYTNTTTIPTGNYKLNTEKSACRIPTSTQVGEDAPKDNNISIEFTDGKLNILGLTTKNTKCYIYLDKHVEPSEETIAKLNITNINSETPTFSNVATTDEGIFKAEDGMYGGNSYYWRGAATTNHVIFADKCWRIVRINGDGTIRLIYNGAALSENKCTGNGTNEESIVKTNIKYNTNNDNSSYVGWTYTVGSQRTLSGTDSNIKKETDSWYNTNIENNTTYSSKVADGKFCNDRNTQDNETWRATGSAQYYAAYQRLSSGTKTPTLACNSGDVYTLRAGAITADEVQFAGASWSSIANTSYYLYNGQFYWTMSPYYWKNGTAYVFIVHSVNGYIIYTGVHGTHGLRPVINLKAEVTFNAGSDGTQDNPYIVQ